MTARKQKLQHAKELLTAEQTNVLNCLTPAELNTLKQHDFDIDAYASNSSAVIVTTKTAADEHELDRIISKLSAEVKRLNAQERLTIHLSKFTKQQ